MSIATKQECDGHINCDQGEDERDCEKDGRLYCEGGSVLFVDKEKVPHLLSSILVGLLGTIILSQITLQFAFWVI